MKNILIAVLVLFLFGCDSGRDNKTAAIIQKMGIVQNISEYLTHTAKLGKVNATSHQINEITELEKSFSDSIIMHNTIEFFDSAFTDSEIDDLYEIINKPVFNKITKTDIPGKILKNFNPILEKLLHFSITNNYRSSEIEQQLELPKSIDRADGFYKVSETWDTDGNQKLIFGTTSILNKSDIKNVYKVPNTNFPEIKIELTEKGSLQFEKFTRQNTGSRLAIVLKKQIISAPKIMSVISGGTVVVTIGKEKINLDELISELKGER